jgi:[acyl-carrier-protein] S-malonyltransferase
VKSSEVSSTLLFPGQGSQFRGMAEGVKRSDAAARLFADAARILEFDLLEVLEDGDKERLGDTAIAQPAIFVTSLALLELARSSAPNAPSEGDADRSTARSLGDVASTAGHSLGEYTALVAAGMLSFEEGLELVAIRGRAMKLACEMTKGAMVALLGADDVRVEEVCAERRAKGAAIWVANLNSPGQVVISGEMAEVQNAIESPREFGARKSVLLDVAGACHTPLMEPASKMLEEALANTRFDKSPILVWSNVTAQPYPSPEDAPELLSRQLVEPVRWRETLENIRSSGGSSFVCFGPADTMAGLARRCLASDRAANGGNDVRLLRIETFDEAAALPEPEII